MSTAASAAPGRTVTPAAPWQVAFVGLASIWGSSFLCIKVLGEVWTPVQVALGRCVLGCLTLLVVLAVRRARLPRDGGLWARLAVVALLMNAAPFALFAVGEQHVSSVVGGLWNATTPLWVLLVVLTFVPEERPDRRRVIGLAVGFVGVILVFGPWRGLGGGELLGHLACATGALCYGLGLPYMRRALAGRTEDGVVLAAIQLLCASAMLVVVAPLSGVPSTALGADAVAALLVLGVLGSGVAYVLTHRIVAAAGPTTFSLVTYVIPVFSTALGVVVLDEPLRWNEPAGAAVVLAATAWSGGLLRLRRPGVAARQAA